MVLPIQEILPADRPREKLRTRGASTLSDVELLAVIIGSGNRTAHVRELATRVVAACKEARRAQLTFCSIEDLERIPGLGQSTALKLAAASEYFSRHLTPSTGLIEKPGDILPLLHPLVTRKQEYFLTVTLNGANEVVGTHVVAIGLANRVEVHPREIFADAIIERACGVIVAHNHQSSYLEPSPADIELTRRLQDAGLLLGIPLLDHIIFNQETYFSFLEQNLLKQ